MLYQHMPYYHPLHRYEHFTVRMDKNSTMYVFCQTVRLERKFRIG